MFVKLFLFSTVNHCGHNHDTDMGSWNIYRQMGVQVAISGPLGNHDSLPLIKVGVQVDTNGLPGNHESIAGSKG